MTIVTPTQAGVTSPQPNVSGTPRRTGFPPIFWAMAALTGAGSGLAAGLLMMLLRLTQHLAWHYRQGTFLEGVTGSSASTRVLVLVLAGVLVAIVLPLLGRLKSKTPSELEATIWFADGRLPPLKTMLKAVFSIVIVGLGASLGREAAPKQAGTLIGGLLAQWARLPPCQRRLLAACGAGAGIAAVYNVPFGGALFALEVLLGTLSLPLVAPAFLATMTGTAAGWLLLPNQPTYHLPSMPLSASLAVWSIVFAPVAGVGAALFIKLVAGVARIKPTRWRIVPAALVVFTGLGGVAIAYPQILGNGKDIVELAALDRIALPTLAMLVVLKPLATAACLGTGAPGGLFTPTIAFGALLGGLFGRLWGVGWPGGDPGAFALVGAGAVLAGTTKGPVSALVLMMELTRHLDGLLVPLLFAIAGAVSVTHWLDPRSTYTSRLGRQADFREADGTNRVSTATRYVDLLHLSLVAERPLRVIDEDGREKGVVTRDALIASAGRLYPVEIATAIDILELEPAC